jgi:hypothetical protein
MSQDEDPILALARALGLLRAKRGSARDWRAWSVAQHALQALADPDDERAAERIDRMYAASLGSKGEGDRALWFDLADLVDASRRFTDAEARARFARQIVETVEGHARASLPAAAVAAVAAELAAGRATSGIVTRILVVAKRGTAGRTPTQLQKAISQALRARRDRSE